MAVKATWLGHSAVLIETGSQNILIDPFLSDNPSASVKPEEIKADLLLLTHDHEDHVGDTEHFLKQGATFVGIHELAVAYGEKGFTAEGMNIGGTIEVGDTKIHMTHALHTSYTGHVVGFIIETEGKQIHHAGDTGLTMDMKILDEFFDIDLAFVPIGDRYTMGATSAAKAIEWMGATIASPIHYATWPPIQGDPTKFKELLGDRAVILGAGESITLE
ncbi:MAG: metal-dependent hydrolase [Candidatus Lindowbacteria bacterium]|nr:metal-dependent hydrolase [Candidatus Lindowbacteria bacterium]